MLIFCKVQHKTAMVASDGPKVRRRPTFQYYIKMSQNLDKFIWFTGILLKTNERVDPSVPSPGLKSSVSFRFENTNFARISEFSSTSFKDVVSRSI